MDPQEDALHRIKSLLLASESIKDEDVEKLLKDTKESALEELRAQLVEAQKEVLISRIEETIESERSPEQSQETKSATDLDVLTSILRRESERSHFEDRDESLSYRIDRKVGAKDSQTSLKSGGSQYTSNGNHNNLYVFGIVRTKEFEQFRSELVEIKTFEESASLRLVSSGSMSAVLCEVNSRLMNQDLLADRMRDSEWLEPHVQTHQRVQKRVMKHVTLIPMRFGALFSSEDRVRDFIKSNRQSLCDSLDRLDDTQEWGVKLFATAAAVDSDQTSQPPSSGQEFFSQKQGELDRDEAQRRDLASKADYVHARLSKCSEEALINDPSNKLATGADTIEALNGVYLINLHNLSHFHETLLNLQNDLELLGYNLQLNGPWPPYHFIRLDTSTGISSPVQ